MKNINQCDTLDYDNKIESTSIILYTMVITGPERRLLLAMSALRRDDLTSNLIIAADKIRIDKPSQEFITLLNEAPYVHIIEKLMEHRTYHWMRWCDWFCYLHKFDVIYWPVAFDSLYGANANFRGFTDILIITGADNADTGRADTGRADTGRADTGRADTGRADVCTLIAGRNRDPDDFIFNINGLRYRRKK